MLIRLTIILGCIALLCGCGRTVSTFEVSPEYLATAHERPMLTVPHREWVEQGCYPKRQLKDGKWVEIKVCDKK